jgi:hypothetical protein
MKFRKLNKISVTNFNLLGIKKDYFNNTSIDELKYRVTVKNLAESNMAFYVGSHFLKIWKTWHLKTLDEQLLSESTFHFAYLNNEKIIGVYTRWHSSKTAIQVAESWTFASLNEIREYMLQRLKFNSMFKGLKKLATYFAEQKKNTGVYLK